MKSVVELVVTELQRIISNNPLCSVQIEQLDYFFCLCVHCPFSLCSDWFYYQLHYVHHLISKCAFLLFAAEQLVDSGFVALVSFLAC